MQNKIKIFSHLSIEYYQKFRRKPNIICLLHLKMDISVDFIPFIIFLFLYTMYIWENKIERIKLKTITFTILI